MSQSVKVVIDKKGNANVDLVGFNGVGCGALAAKLAQNGRVTSEENKAEFYETNSNDQTVTQG
jgi:tRNA A58 N-methylase Trm61